MRSYLSIFILLAFLANSIGLVPTANAEPIYGAEGEFHLPAPGVLVLLSPPLDPPILKGIKVHPDNPFKFDFILDHGSSFKQEGEKEEAIKLIKYFLASVTIPDNDLWVNLSPYEKNRIIPKSFGLTEMGRDLLAEDYMLKQITASLIYPEKEMGKKFWSRVYEESQKKFGTTNIPVNTFNKVWIIPEKAIVYENAKAGTAYVVEAKLKVMLEQDYLSLQKHGIIHNDVASIGSNIVREVIIPELTKEVNEGKNFSQLRQVYNSLILATWYKKKIKDSIFNQIYADKNKTAGVISRENDTEFIYQRYLEAFKKGVFNYIKEIPDPVTQEIITRKYFSGGMLLRFKANKAMIITHQLPDSAMSAHADIVSTTIEGIMRTKVWRTENDRNRFSGKSLFTRNDRRFDWLSLTDHIQVEFVERSKAPANFLEVQEAVRKNKDEIYKFILPDDISIGETLGVIRSMRKLDDHLSLKETTLPQLHQKFKQAAVFMAREYQGMMTDDIEHAVKVLYGLGDIFSKESMDNDEIPTVDEIAKEEIEAEQEEVLQWLGIDYSNLRDIKINGFFEKVIALAVQGVQIRAEELTYWRGMQSFQDSFSTTGRAVIYTKALRDRIEAMKEGYGNDSPQAAEVQINVIQAILKEVLTKSGWVAKNGEFASLLESSPSRGRLKEEINCLGRSSLMAMYLEELGIKFWTVGVEGHIFLLAQLSDGRYYKVEPSGNLNSSKVISLPLKSIPSQGTSIILDGEWGYICPWRNGLLAGFYLNLGLALRNKGDLKGAMAAYHKALSINLNMPEVYNNIGIILMGNNDFEGAIMHFKKAISINTRNYIAHVNLGNIYYDRGIRDRRDKDRRIRDQGNQYMEEARKMFNTAKYIARDRARLSNRDNSLTQKGASRRGFLKKFAIGAVALGGNYILSTSLPLHNGPRGRIISWDKEGNIMPWEEHYDPRKPTLLFMHGGEDTDPLQTAAKIKALGTESGYNVFMYKYDYLNSFDSLVSDFTSELEALRAKIPNHQKLTVVAYSLAPLIVRGAVLRDENILKGTSYIQVAPIAGGAQEADLSKWHLSRAEVLKTIMEFTWFKRDEVYTAEVANPYGKIQEELFSRRNSERFDAVMGDYRTFIPDPHLDTVSMVYSKDQDVLTRYRRGLGQHVTVIPGAKHENALEVNSTMNLLGPILKSQNHAMSAKYNSPAPEGGIDLTANKTTLEIQSTGLRIKFHLDPAMLQQLRNARGFVPVIINIQPLINLRQFLYS